MSHKKPNIALIGMMGCGKSSVAKELIKLLPDFNLVETDNEIEVQENLTINEIFNQKGEEYFRNAEVNLLNKITQQDKTIISCGGGVFLNETNRKNLLEKTFCIHLIATPETIIKRLKNDTTRPLLNGNNLQEKIKTILTQRLPIYSQTKHKIHTDLKTPKQIATEILEKYKSYGN